MANYEAVSRAQSLIDRERKNADGTYADKDIAVRVLADMIDWAFDRNYDVATLLDAAVNWSIKQNEPLS
jgi:hypothetical protein